MKNNFKHILLSGVILGSLAISCVPDTIDGDGNGLAIKETVPANFTITETSPNRYRLEATESNYITNRWKIGDDPFYTGKNVENIFIPDAGTYVIEHQATAQGGLIAGQSQQTITVGKSDPMAGNLIQGGKFADANDHAKWSMAFPNPNDTASWTFSNGKATFFAKKWDRNVLYQEIQVEAGRTYQADALVSSDTGVSESWFEIYVGYTKPTPNTDYSGDGADNTWLRAINTWANSGSSPFNGRISNVGSKNENNPDGTFTATKTGTVYFAIRSGGNDYKGGISVTNVEFRGIN